MKKNTKTENTDPEFTFEFQGGGCCLGKLVVKAKDIGEAYAKAREIGRTVTGATSIKHGRGVYTL